MGGYKVDGIDVRILYALLALITALAVIMHLTTDETVSLYVLLLIGVIVLTNFLYLYPKLRKPTRKI